ncbi:MAG TPA: hypothetical protein VIV66_15710 [Pyrinomonadaceae bacterium]
MATIKTKSAKKRVKVGKLPSKAKKLSTGDAKKVKGGIIAVLKVKEKW